MFTLPVTKLFDTQSLRQIPILATEVFCDVFGEEAGVLDITECIQIRIGNVPVLCAFFFPGVDQVLPGLELALKAVGSSRIFAANLELTSAFHQAVGDPALKGGVIVGKGAGRQIEGVTVRYPVTSVDFAAGCDDRN